MAIQSINTLRNWFKRGLKPLQQQFWDWMDSYWHKEESIPMNKVDQLETTLNTLSSTKAPLGVDGKIPIDLIPPAADTFKQGGNSFGTTAGLGTLDNYPLSLKTNGLERLRVTADGTVETGGDARVSGKLSVNTGNVLNNSLYTYLSNWGGSAGYVGFGFANTSAPALPDSVFDIYQGPAAAPGHLFSFKHILADNTGGNHPYSIIDVSTGINQTNGSNGVVRGIYYNPAITALNGEHHAIETVTGNVLLGTTSGNTLIGTAVDAGYKLDVNGNTRINGTLTMATDSNSLGYITNNSIYGGWLNIDFTSPAAGAGGGIRLRHAGNIYAQLMTASPTNPFSPTGFLIDVPAGHFDCTMRASGKLFRWGRTNTMNGSGAQMTFDPFNTRLIIGMAADNGATLQVNGTTMAGDDIEINQANKGIVLKSPNGTRYRLTVADNGTLITTAL